MDSNNLMPLLREVKSKSKNIKYQSYLTADDEFSITPLDTIIYSSYFFSGILFPEIIIDAIFCWLSLLWELYKVEGGIQRTDNTSLSAILVFYCWLNFDFVIYIE